MWKKIKDFFDVLFKKHTKKNIGSISKNKNYIDKYRKSDSNIECREYQQNIFDNTNVGDLLYCDMPLSKKELNTIPEGHRTRPYYIAYKLNNGFIAYGLQSNMMKYVSNLKQYKLDNIKYTGISRKSYICLYKEVYLPKNKIIRFMFSLDDDDFNQVNRRLYSINTYKYINIYKSKPLLYKPLVGDIIKYKKLLWLIVGAYDDNYDVLQIKIGKSDEDIEKTYINCNNEVYTVFLNKRNKIPTNINLITKDIINKNILSELILSINEDKTYWKCINVGSIIMYNNIIYYCFKINEYNMSAYKVSYNSDDLKYTVLINDEGKNIYIDTKRQYTIVSSEKVKLITHLNRKNIKIIECAIAHKKTKRKIKEYYTEMEIGTILRDMNNEEFVYLFSNDECYFCVNTYEYLNPDVFEDYSLYSVGKTGVSFEGETTDEDLKQILADQLFHNRDKEDILLNKYNELS